LIDNVTVDREAEQILSDHIQDKYPKVMVHQGNDHSSGEQTAVLQMVYIRTYRKLREIIEITRHTALC
jgi:hypothetical protein